MSSDDWHMVPPVVVDEIVPRGEAHIRDDHGKTLAKIKVPLTQAHARDQIITDYHAEHCGCDYADCETWADTAFVVDHVLSASPEVLAAAMGGTALTEHRMVGTRPRTPTEDDGSLVENVWEPRTVIVLPSREVSRGDQ